MIRAGIYIRKSKQDKGQEAYRLELQRTKLPAYAGSQGWAFEIYDDGIISGSDVDNRKEMVRLVSDVEKGHINVILCIEFSRLSRDDSMTDFLTFLNLCATKKVKLATPERNLDPTDTASWFLAIIEGGFSAVEMKTLKKRIVEGKRVARSKGRWGGGVPPYGYIYDKPSKTLVPHPETAKIVQSMYRLRVKMGRTVDQIAKTARAEQWPLPRGGKHWWSKSVVRILNSPLYCGLVRFDGNFVKGANVPLVEKAEWDMAQVVRHRPAGRRTPSLLLTGSGRTRCGYCGSTANCITSRGRPRLDGTFGKTLRYYHCYGRTQGVECRQLRNIPSKQLEDLALSILGEVSKNKRELLDGIQQVLLKRQGELPKQRRQLENRLRQSSLSAEKLLDAYEKGAISLEQLKTRNESHRQETETLQKAIMETDFKIAKEGGNIDLATLEKRLDHFRERLSSAAIDELRELVDPLISGVKLFNDRAEISFSFPVDGKYTHVYPLDNGAHEKKRPRSSMDQSTRLLSVKYRFDSCRGHVPLNVLAAAHNKVAMDRASAF